MTILKIRLIVLIERLKKVTAVAQELGMKQPTVSFHMKKMEEEWGVPLFESKTGKVLLTEAGRMLHHYAQQIDKIYTEAESRMLQLRDGGSQTVKIGCTALTSALVLTSRWFKENQALQKFVNQFVTDSSERLAARLEDGELDLVVTAEPPADARFQKELLKESPLQVWLAHDHPFARMNELTIIQLRNMKYAALDEPAIGRQLLARDAVDYAELPAGILVSQPFLVGQAVQGGGVFSIMPSMLDSPLSGPDNEKLAGIPLAGKPAVLQIYAVWPKAHWNPKLLMQVAQSLAV
ncbi:LysR family transcriptional regulator [Paenibacillus protaetiae]|uniref:LysR family transcriptional regulator n=1 Tax=Paenibacillus protaetiae TaxID=2509456 RepID=A0A4P6EXU8_9BACL|nr:LysR family transcriptional regulator [Paenibacillus protaetiae]QAY66579.1 LysR family transcriptional regulator [Paenibacillus protaetiae]